MKYLISTPVYATIFFLSHISLSKTAISKAILIPQP